MKQDILDQKERTEAEFLAEYKPKNYAKPSVTVDIVILSDTIPKEVLLVKRKQHPFIEQWAIPGGFVEMDENLVDSAKRELKEETGVEALTLSQLHAYGDVHRDPRMRVISIAYMALLKQPVEVIAADDAKDAKWFCIEEHNNTITLYEKKDHIRIHYTIENGKVRHKEPSESLAFDHIHILMDALHSQKK